MDRDTASGNPSLRTRFRGAVAGTRALAGDAADRAFAVRRNLSGRRKSRG